MENSLSYLLSDASNSCQRSPSVLSLSVVEDETLEGDAEAFLHKEDSCSSVLMDGSEMMRDKPFFDLHVVLHTRLTNDVTMILQRELLYF